MFFTPLKNCRDSIKKNIIQISAWYAFVIWYKNWDSWIVFLLELFVIIRTFWFQFYSYLPGCCLLIFYVFYVYCINEMFLKNFSMQDNGDGKFSWLNVKPPYSCAVASPKKESKLKGLKSYIAYQLTPSVSTYTKYKLNQILFFTF